MNPSKNPVGRISMGSENPESTPEPIVEFVNVSKTFNPGTSQAFTALKDVNFRIEDKADIGEFISIVGPSGCGKSTILNLIHGFRDVYPPTTGEVRVKGKRVTGPGPDRGMIFQKYSSFPNRTVLRNITFGLELAAGESGLSRREMDEMAMEWIQKVGLEGHEQMYPHQLSGGQQQRVAIARTLVLKPGIILMDEPFSALDEPTRYEMQELITGLWHEVEATVFIVTHSLSEAVYLGDRVWIMGNSPGHIAVVFEDTLPPPRDGDPMAIQEESHFKEIVREVGKVFSDIEAGKVS